MSAAQAGQGGTGGDGGQAAAGGEAAAQAFDASALESALAPIQQGQDALRQQLGQFGEFLQSEPWRPQEAVQEDPGIDLSFLDEGMYSPAIGEAERAQYGQQFASQIDQRAQQIAQQQVAPLQQQVQEMQLQNVAAQVVSEFPELADPQVVERLAPAARDFAQSIGLPAEKATHPLVFRAAYMMDRAAQAANAEGSAQGQQAATLESGNGSGPGVSATSEAQQRMDAIFGDGSRKGASVLPWS